MEFVSVDNTRTKQHHVSLVNCFHIDFRRIFGKTHNSKTANFDDKS